MHSNNLKKLWNLMLVFALCIVACFGAGCNGVGSTSSSSETQQGEQTPYVLNQPVLELNVGETFTLSVLNIQEVESVEWRSLQASVANVDGAGTVTAVTPGETRILATVNGKTLTCIVTVKISLNVLPTLELKGMQKQDGEYTLRLMKGDEYTLNPVLYLGGEVVETTFTLTSNETAVAIEGNVLKANAETATAQITVSCTYENQTYSVVCYVSVEEVA